MKCPAGYPDLKIVLLMVFRHENFHLSVFVSFNEPVGSYHHPFLSNEFRQNDSRRKAYAHGERFPMIGHGATY